MKQIVRKTVSFFLVLCLVIATVLAPGGGMAYAKKVIKKVVVKSQKELNKALAKKLVKNVEIKSGSKKLKIKKGSYNGVKLAVNSAKTRIVNSGTFNQIQIKKAAAFSENGDGNTINSTASKLKLEVQKNAKNLKIAVAKKKSQNTVTVNGSVTKLSVSKPSSKTTVRLAGILDTAEVNAASELILLGETDNAVRVNLNKAGASFSTSVKSDINVIAKANITLEKGSGDSIINVAGDASDASIVNNSGKDVKVYSTDGQGVAKAGDSVTVDEIITKKPTSQVTNPAETISGGGGSGGGGGGGGGGAGGASGGGSSSGGSSGKSETLPLVDTKNLSTITRIESNGDRSYKLFSYDSKDRMIKEELIDNNGVKYYTHDEIYPSDMTVDYYFSSVGCNKSEDGSTEVETENTYYKVIDTKKIYDGTSTETVRRDADRQVTYYSYNSSRGSTYGTGEVTVENETYRPLSDSYKYTGSYIAYNANGDMTCREVYSKTAYGAERTVVSVTTCTYDGDSRRLLTSETVYADGTTETTVNTYNDNKDLVTGVTTYRDGTSKSIEYTYNDHGDCTKYVETYTDGSKDFSDRICTYNEQGQLIREECTVTYARGNTYSYVNLYGYDGGNTNYIFTSVDGTTDSGNYEIKEWTFTDGMETSYTYSEYKNGVIVDKTYTEYDGNGREIKTTWLNGSIGEYVHDALGNISKYTYSSTDVPGSSYSTVYSYDSYGNETGHETRYADGRYEISLNEDDHDLQEEKTSDSYTKNENKYNSIGTRVLWVDIHEDYNYGETEPYYACDSTYTYDDHGILKKYEAYNKDDDGSKRQEIVCTLEYDSEGYPISADITANILEYDENGTLKNSTENKWTELYGWVAKGASTGTIPATPVVSDTGAVLNIRCWNTEFVNRVEDHYPGYVKVDSTTGKIGDVTVKWNITPSADDEYQQALDTALQAQSTASADDKVDLFLVEQDYALKYVESDYAMPVSELGITASELSDQYKYTQDVVTDSKGVLKGVSWQICPGALIYNRDIALEVLGTEDPAEVQAYVSDWAKYEDTADMMVDAGYRMVGTPYDAYRVYSQGVSSKWVENGTINIDPNLVKWANDSKYLVDEGAADKDILWSDSWARGFYGGTFCFFGPEWLYYFCMGDGESGAVATNGRWGVTVGPQGFYWGGTWLCAATGTDNAALVGDIIRKLTCDQDIMKEIFTADCDLPNNKKVMADIAASTYTASRSRVLGGQNPASVFMASAEAVDQTHNTVYDYACNEAFQAFMEEYFNGESTYEAAINAFYSSITRDYPQLTY